MGGLSDVRATLAPKREEYLINRVRHILNKYSEEPDRRKAFANTCGTVQERLAFVDKHCVIGGEFHGYDMVILNRR